MFLNLILNFGVYLIGFVFNRQGNLKNIVDKITEKIGEKNLENAVEEKRQVETESPLLPVTFTWQSVAGNVFGAGFLRIFLGLFFLILLIYPSCIRHSIKESGIETGTKYLLRQIKSVEVNGFGKLTTKDANELAQVKDSLKELIEFTDNPQTKQKLESDVTKLKNLEDEIKKQVAVDTPPSIKQADNWVYLGKAESDKLTWKKVETFKESIKIQDLKENTVITFTDEVYLRTGNCPHSEGDIVGAVLRNSTATIIGNLDFCTIKGTNNFGVWAKVKIN